MVKERGTKASLGRKFLPLQGKSRRGRFENCFEGGNIPTGEHKLLQSRLK